MEILTIKIPAKTVHTDLFKASSIMIHLWRTIECHKLPEEKTLTVAHSNHLLRTMLVPPPSILLNLLAKIKVILLGKIQINRYLRWVSHPLITGTHHHSSLSRVHRHTQIHVPNSILRRCRQTNITHRVSNRPGHLSQDSSIHVLISSNSLDLRMILKIVLMMTLMMLMKVWSFPDKKGREK